MDTILLPAITHLLAGLMAALVTQWVTRQNHHQTKANREHEAEIASCSIRREKLLDAFHAIYFSEPQRHESKKLSNDELIKQERMRSAAFADIGLFGDERLIQLLDPSIQESTNYDTSILMKRLRDFLRELHGLESTDAYYQRLKIQPPPKTDEFILNDYEDVDSESQI